MHYTVLEQLPRNKCRHFCLIVHQTLVGKFGQKWKQFWTKCFKLTSTSFQDDSKFIAESASCPFPKVFPLSCLSVVMMLFSWKAVSGLFDFTFNIYLSLFRQSTFFQKVCCCIYCQALVCKDCYLACFPSRSSSLYRFITVNACQQSSKSGQTGSRLCSLVAVCTYSEKRFLPNFFLKILESFWDLSMIMLQSSELKEWNQIPHCSFSKHQPSRHYFKNMVSSHCLILTISVEMNCLFGCLSATEPYSCKCSGQD